MADETTHYVLIEQPDRLGLAELTWECLTCEEKVLVTDLDRHTLAHGSRVISVFTTRDALEEARRDGRVPQKIREETADG